MRHQGIDAFRGLMVIFVTGIHAFGYSDMTGMAATATWLIVSTIATAGFFLADGYLLALSQHRQARPWTTQVKQDGYRLLLPWLVFSLLYAGGRWFLETRHLAPPLVTEITGLAQFSAVIWQSLAAPQLYFLPALFLVRQVSYGLQKAASSWHGAMQSTSRDYKEWLIILPLAWLALFILQIETTWIALWPPLGIDPPLQALRGLGFFWLGFFIAPTISQGQLPAMSRMSSAPVIVALTAGLCLFVPKLQGLGGQLLYLFITFYLFTHLARGLKFDRLAMLGRETMIIFLLHAPFTLKAMDLLLDQLHTDMRPPLAKFLILLVLSLITALMLGRFARYLGFGWLFGERSTNTNSPISRVKGLA